MKKAIWSGSLHCNWIAWRVVAEGHLALDLPVHNCCDMRGAIEAAQKLCPMVWRIDTYSGAEASTRYEIDGKAGTWLSYEFDRFAGRALSRNSDECATHDKT